MRRSVLASVPLVVLVAIWSCGDGGGGGDGAGGGDATAPEAGTPGRDAHVGPDADAASATDGTGAADVHASEAGTDAGDASSPHATTAGCPLPSGWTLKIADRFGTGAGANVSTAAQLHAKYYEAQFYNRDANGLVLVPNVVINHEQETYVHFEEAIAFSADHLTIQGRGHADGAITSGEMVSIYTARSLCVEGRYRIPSAAKSWPALWLYGAGTDHDLSEIDIEQPVTPNQGVHDVSMYNHPSATTDGGFPGNVTVVDPKFTTTYMTWTDPSFDASAAPHAYTACYDDASATITRCIDGKVVYTAAWKWNASLGGTGHGDDACTTFNLAVGGDWPGNLADPSGYSGDLDLYSLEYYGP